ncbi:DUF1783-domain-containing protein [Wolfiporia cocos MD-104 SS10]|uniref:DUF1783-domain-containing protein n=1 Tax=Wolfiporia cocos (strain MD-104) TaxID=742152 RepID=A0A2H3J6N1_WOLCO|nr:DUF1783-domain-containing protein [Wolfiporia cocos MD-104 SS10]
MTRTALCFPAFSRRCLGARQPVPLFIRTQSTSTELPRPPPKEPPPTETFSAPSRPHFTHQRRERDLPPLERRWPTVLAFGVVGVASWTAFMAYTNNQERLSSSVVRHILETVRETRELQQVLGDAIRPEPVWWLNGDPYINGSIHLMQGNIDLSFRIKGHKNAGTLYFTSIRKAKGDPFTVLRFKVIADDGTVVNVPEKYA